MLSTSAIVAWLGSEGIKVIIGAIASAALQWWNSQQARQDQLAAGRLAAERDAATAKAAAADRVAAQAAQPTSEDAAISALAEGAA